MRFLKTNPLLRLVNSYIVDSPEPANISYLWNFGSLLGTCLILQILTGIFLAMHVRPLIIMKPVTLITITELNLCKPNDLSVIEMMRGVEHVVKVQTVNSYNLLKGEVLFIYVLLKHLSQDARLILKVTVTRLWRKTMESAYTVFNSLCMTYSTWIGMKTKDEIKDFTMRTGDLLTQAIGILVLETKTFDYNTQKGDGAIVVPTNREGLQDSIHSKVQTRTIVHQNPLLKANAASYYLKPAHSRCISSKPLNDINLYKKAYDDMKSNPGNMTPGTDHNTLDGMSLTKLTKLRDSVINCSYNCKPTKRIYIPKSNGKLRPLGIPSITDKILQTVIKYLIEPKCEEIFHPKSFAFRPGRSVHHALIEVQSMMGITWMIEGDIKSYFDSIDHHIMAKIIKDRINPDRMIMGLIWKFFKAGYMEENNYRHSSLGVPLPLAKGRGWRNTFTHSF